MSLYQTALGELAAVFSRLDDGAVDAVIARLAVARRIVVFGGGGERLQIMGFALRMFPMGLNAAVEGDMTTPFVDTGDVFLVTCGPGWIATAEALMQVARSAGAECILITAQPTGRCAALADLVLGGARLGGGRGSVLGCFPGVLLVAITQNGLNLLGYRPMRSRW